MIPSQDVDIRAPEIWHIVSQNVDFRKKTVADLGCGHGEMLWRALLAGADLVYGFDTEIRDYAKDLAIIYPAIKVIEIDLNATVEHGSPYWLKEEKL